ncbi:2-phosphosulfolactate phosphatase [Nocardioides scoriae]|uniref:Probable 2-phosphosulfolactate phosphatase n=1 Tax=Nocardioides scoriae TaxID=642780 RepID=A0A1H1TKP5_9ACTN|nr:2-phosphosulfolactate phosphatase [Nocardioides scoriae]SDS60109.1 2-phosphosulfolactate phosphatase [Nocardioides scoriae]
MTSSPPPPPRRADEPPRRLLATWGVAGALAAVEEGVRTAVVVDVLSFSTTVSVAADLGIEVLPHAWEGSAAAYALQHGATLARRRLAAGPGEVSLSPTSLRRSGGVRRLVLPSPNGSTICAALADADVVVAAGCLRNAVAVGAWLAEQPGDAVVVAAGERWGDDSLRPALEDLLGAGAVLAAARSTREPDGEAEAAVAAYADAGDRLADRVRRSRSGVELDQMGFAADVEVALETGSSTLVPVLDAGVFAPA